MIDLNIIRQDIQGVADKLAKRGATLDVAQFQALEAKRKTLQTDTQELQHARNSRSKSIGQAKAKGEDIAPLLAEVSGLGEQLKEKEDALQLILDDMQPGIIPILHCPGVIIPGQLGPIKRASEFLSK